MAEIVTIVGGQQASLNINPLDVQAAQNALNNLGQGYTAGNVLKGFNNLPPPGALDIYNINVPPGGSFTLPAGAEGVAFTGTASGKMTGYAGKEVLIGNAGNDTIDAAGGNGTIIVGNRNNEIMLNGTQPGGNVTILAGTGKNHIDMWGGNVSLSGMGTENVEIHGGSNTLVAGQTPPPNTKLNLTVDGGANSITLDATKGVISVGGGANTFNLTGGGADTFKGGGANITATGGAYQLSMSGNDSITLGSGNDTITETGKATINAGSGTLSVKGGAGDLNVVLGSGNATLVGAGGNDTFTAGSGKALMKGGAGSNEFSAGAQTVGSGGHTGSDSNHYAVVGNTTMDAAGGGHNLFTFGAGIFGSTQTVKHFVHGADHIHLVGLDTASAVFSVAGSTETISFDGGATKIVLLNISGPITGSDFT